MIDLQVKRYNAQLKWVTNAWVVTEQINTLGAITFDGTTTITIESEGLFTENQTSIKGTYIRNDTSALYVKTMTENQITMTYFQAEVEGDKILIEITVFDLD